MKNFLLKHLMYLFFLSALVPVQAQQGTGLLFDDESYAAQPRLSPSLSFTGADAQVKSLKKYCPKPDSQGQMGSCVGWASAYAALSISDAVQRNITDMSQITSTARSALYVYNQIKVAGCDAGSYIHHALELMQEKGVPKMRDFYPDNCYDQPDDDIHALASELKIKEYNTLFQISDASDIKIAQTRNSLLANKPVVIGMQLTNSFYRVGSAGVWAPVAGERNVGGHAMAVIGFNDYTQQFEILNSWGDDWGDGGYFRISYKDYANYCKYGYQFSLKANAPDPNGFTFNAAFKINKITGYDYTKETLEYAELPARKNGNYYFLSEGALAKGDYFKIFAGGMTADNYLYIFSVKPDDTAELLFPKPSGNNYDNATVVVIPVIPSFDSYVELPAEKDRAIMADHSGTDYLVFLFAANRIDNIEEVVENVANGYGDMYDRLEGELADRMVPDADITYYMGQMGFRGNASSGDIVPVVLEVVVK